MCHIVIFRLRHHSSPLHASLLRRTNCNDPTVRDIFQPSVLQVSCTLWARRCGHSWRSSRSCTSAVSTSSSAPAALKSAHASRCASVSRQPAALLRQLRGDWLVIVHMMQQDLAAWQHVLAGRARMIKGCCHCTLLLCNEKSCVPSVEALTRHGAQTFAGFVCPQAVNVTC